MGNKGNVLSMNIIKLMSHFGVSLVNIDNITCVKSLSYRKNGCCSSTLIGYQWMDWHDNFEDVLAVLKDQLPFIKLHYHSEVSYLNVNKVEVVCKSDIILFNGNSRTYVTHRWLDWDETVDEINDLIEKVKR